MAFKKTIFLAFVLVVALQFVMAYDDDDDDDVNDEDNQFQELIESAGVCMMGAEPCTPDEVHKRLVAVNKFFTENEFLREHVKNDNIMNAMSSKFALYVDVCDAKSEAAHCESIGDKINELIEHEKDQNEESKNMVDYLNSCIQKQKDACKH